MRVQPERLWVTQNCAIGYVPLFLFIKKSDKIEQFLFLVNIGGYIQAVLDRNLAENISRVLYPNDNVS